MQISELTTIPQSPANADVLAIEVGGVTYKVNKQTLASAILSQIGAGSLSASPSMLVNLASTAAANVMQASPRPGVTGVLPTSNGGTGRNDFRLRASGLADTNLDNFTEAYIGYIGNCTATGFSGALNGALWCASNYNGERIFQFFMGVAGTRLIYRVFASGSWSDWQSIYPEQRMTKEFSFTASSAMTRGARVAVVQQSLPSGVTGSNIRAIFISTMTGASDFYVVPTVNNGTLYISIYAASTSNSASCSGTVTVVY